MWAYEHVKVLGQGGYGKAILARRKADRKLVVIKEVKLNGLPAKERQDAMKEAEVLASMKHPNIVEYCTSFTEKGQFHIVMEYADGGDLAQKIGKRGRSLLSEDEILHDFIQIALAIKYIHDRKILHRDLKAQNVFLTKDGRVKLGDFGIARVLQDTFQLCQTRIGTPYYLSPEICQGKNYNSKTDIWSLGCILYELCTLKHAFDGMNVNNLFMNIIRGKYTPISSQYSQDLRNLVSSILRKDPKARPSINQILTLPFIRAKLSSLLDQALIDYEFSHTVLHGRRPLAAPTVIMTDDNAPQPEKPAVRSTPRKTRRQSGGKVLRPVQQLAAVLNGDERVMSPQKSPAQHAKHQAHQRVIVPPNVDPRYPRVQPRQMESRNENRQSDEERRKRELQRQKEIEEQERLLEEKRLQGQGKQEIRPPESKIAYSPGEPEYAEMIRKRTEEEERRRATELRKNQEREERKKAAVERELQRLQVLDEAKRQAQEDKSKRKAELRRQSEEAERLRRESEERQHEEKQQRCMERRKEMEEAQRKKNEMEAQKREERLRRMRDAAQRRFELRDLEKKPEEVEARRSSDEGSADAEKPDEVQNLALELLGSFMENVGKNAPAWSNAEQHKVEVPDSLIRHDKKENVGLQLQPIGSDDVNAGRAPVRATKAQLLVAPIAVNHCLQPAIIPSPHPKKVLNDQTRLRLSSSKLADDESASESTSSEGTEVRVSPTRISDEAVLCIPRRRQNGMRILKVSASLDAVKKPLVEPVSSTASGSDEADAQDEQAKESEFQLLTESIREALDIDEQQAQEDDSFEDTRQEPGEMYVNGRKLDLPAVSDSDSLASRTDVIRAFLEREIGLEKLIALNQQLEHMNRGGQMAAPDISDIHPGFIYLAQQLMVLHSEIAARQA